MSVIDIKNMSKTFFGKRNSKIEALKEISLNIEKGEVFGFLGPNGAGKSTTIKCLLGLIKPSSGIATIMGEVVGSVASRKQVGYLPENPAFFDYLSAEEYLKFVGASFKMPKELLEHQTEVSLRQLELWDARNRPMRSYSKGMVQRVGLAQVLLHDPEVYILDEPMSGLDPIGRALVKNIILELKGRGKSVFFSTHITADVESVCDRVGIIMNGELKSVENVGSIMAQGVIGYTLYLSSNIDSQCYVPRDQIQSAMQDIMASGTEITLIEPCRKSLEDFFLDIVTDKGGNIDPELRSR